MKATVWILLLALTVVLICDCMSHSKGKQGKEHKYAVGKKHGQTKTQSKDKGHNESPQDNEVGNWHHKSKANNDNMHGKSQEKNKVSSDKTHVKWHKKTKVSSDKTHVKWHKKTKLSSDKTHVKSHKKSKVSSDNTHVNSNEKSKVSSVKTHIKSHGKSKRPHTSKESKSESTQKTASISSHKTGPHKSSDGQTDATDTSASHTSSTSQTSHSSSHEAGESSSSSDFDTSSSSSSSPEDPKDVYCMKDNNAFPVGWFDDPTDTCRRCKCHENGDMSCQHRPCETPECGKSLQSIPEFECCPVCDDRCSLAICPARHCRTQYYEPDSCCITCGCSYNGVIVPQGPFGEACDGCVCAADGYVTCLEPDCPTEKLKCVNPVRHDNCTFACPRGQKTCAVGNTVIEYGAYKTIGNKICTCLGDWFPNAFCAKKRIPARVQALNCVAECTEP